MDISVSIAICLKRNNKTQRELARQLSVSEQTMSSYMKSKQHPRSIVIQQMAEFFNLKTSEFIALGE